MGVKLSGGGMSRGECPGRKVLHSQKQHLTGRRNKSITIKLDLFDSDQKEWMMLSARNVKYGECNGAFSHSCILCFYTLFVNDPCPCVGRWSSRRHSVACCRRNSLHTYRLSCCCCSKVSSLLFFILTPPYPPPCRQCDVVGNSVDTWNVCSLLDHPGFWKDDESHGCFR